MIRRVRLGAALASAAFLLTAGAPRADAALSASKRCVVAVAQQSAKYVKARLTAIRTCNDANLIEAGSCLPGDLAARIAFLESKVALGIIKKCAPLNPFALQLEGFPGKCPAAPGPFTVADLVDCQITQHARLVDELIDLQYGATAGPLNGGAAQCQAGIAKHGANYVKAVLKIVQKCRNAIFAGKMPGVLPSQCATVGENPTALAKAADKLRFGIVKACAPPFIPMLDVCDPPASTIEEVQDCLLATHEPRVFDPDPMSPADMIDFEYAEPAVCGDGVQNGSGEECDIPDDAACPGLCGGPMGDFPCLCLNKKRQRAIEHEETDLDLGWTGTSHDSEILEGGGFIIDLYECDGVGDPECIMGPNCSDPPHSPCSDDATCGFLGQGTCRKERTAVGPHCEVDIQKACIADGTAADTACPGPGNFCKQTFHTPPLPLSSGGVSVCVVSIFSEDIVGTTNLATGSSSFRLRQNSITHLGQGPINQPCPVCGGFCRGNPGAAGVGGPGERTLCDEDADCPTTTLGPPLCVTDAICSFGPNVNKPCRQHAPYGAATLLFGAPSVDCPPANNISGPTGADILFNPATTGTVELKPSVQCDGFGFGGKVCIDAGSPLDLGKPCTVDGDCPGGAAGACSHQCFCPSNGVAQKPNDCAPACVSSGADDGLPCNGAPDCPTGFCHLGDCRLNPADTDSNQEGVCTAGPVHGACSYTYIRGCVSDAQCAPPGCTFCRPADECIGGANDGAACAVGGDCPGGTCGETCIIENRQCFVPTGIVRVGQPGVPDRMTASIFCIPPTLAAAVNATSGLAGPGAVLTPGTVVTTGF